eukprot:8197912-Alexandrium_andersonii.AAC.1
MLRVRRRRTPCRPGRACRQCASWPPGGARAPHGASGAPSRAAGWPAARPARTFVRAASLGGERG